jgi:hypothetical protein
MAELGNLTASYCAPSAANVNCENPRGKPVLHLRVVNLSQRSGFAPSRSRFSSVVHRTLPSFTGCTQPVRDSGLRESIVRVQSRNREFMERRMYSSAERDKTSPDRDVAA